MRINPISSPVYRGVLLAVCAFVMSATVTRAQIVFDTTPYGSGHTVPDSLPPSIVPNGLAVSDITRGPGLSPNVLNYGFSSNGWHNTEGGNATRESAIAQGNFYQLSIGVNAGYQLSLDTLDYRHRRSTTANSGLRLGSYEWQYSFDGFATDGITFFSGAFALDEGPGDGVTHPTIFLSAISEFQNLPEGTELTMRLFAWGAAVTNTNTFAFGRALSSPDGEVMDPNIPTGGPVFGVTVIPEPSTYALILGGISLLVLAVRRHRRIR